MKWLWIVIFCCLVAGCAGHLGNRKYCSSAELPGYLDDVLGRACKGDQHASLEIGMYYEALAKHAPDNELYYKKAASFYRIAATASSDQTFIYIPGAGDVAGYTMPIQTGAVTYGVAEAQYRLALLYRDGKGVKQDKGLAIWYLESAAKQGHFKSNEELQRK